MCSPARAPGGNVLSFKPSQMLFNSSEQPDGKLWGWYVSPVSPAAMLQLLPQHLWRGSSMCLPQNIALSTVLSVIFLFLFPFLIPCLCFPLTQPRHRLTTVCTSPWKFSFWLKSFCHGWKARSASEDLGWKGRIKLVLHSLHLWLFECLAGTLVCMRVVCRQTGLTNLQQMPTAVGAAGYCQCMRRHWMLPNKNFSPSCGGSPSAWVILHNGCSAAGVWSNVPALLFVVIIH